jgi:large conductance mechanosensitive channel
MTILEEFKAFALKGNMIDIAVGIVIGVAFQKVIDGFVNLILMPVVGLIIGGVDFKHLYVVLGRQTFETLEMAEKSGAPLLKYGAFINIIIDFFIVAWAIFLAIKVMNRLRGQAEAEKPAAPPEPVK